jgi:dTDP-4-amino-4,6-dideoxygalactose transaminase
LAHNLAFAEWGAREFFAAASGPLMPTCKGSRDVLLQRLREIYAVDPIFLFDRARTGLKIALRNLGRARPERNEVIFPAFICPAVYQAIQECGLIPVAADIDRDLNIDIDDVERRITNRTLAVLAAHMYGAPARIQHLEHLCRSRGLFLIDDAAQVAGVDVDGRQLGSFGDCGILSFGQSKTIVAGAGGALLLRNDSLRAGIQRDWHSLKPETFKSVDLVMLLRDITWQAQTRAIKYYSRKLTKAGNVSSTIPVKSYALGDVRAAIALHQLDSLEARVVGRKRVANLYSQHLSSDRRIKFVQYARDRYLTRIVIALHSSNDIGPLRHALTARGIQTRLGYQVAIDHAGELPNFESLRDRLLELPSHSAMSERQIAKICDKLTQALQGYPMRAETTGPSFSTQQMRW